jgi:NADH-quinone oxidoreductase subunit A
MNFLKILFVDYVSIFLIFLLAAGLAVILVLLSYLIVNEKPDFEKLSTYECGYEPYDSSRHIFNIKFFLIAILFVIFDIEILFLIPWCICVSSIDLLSFWSVVDFIFELSVGFFFVWYSNSLNW